LEHEVFQVGDAILHRQRYLDDILVLGQHLPLLAIGAHLGDVALEFLLDRREIDVQAGFDGTVVFTETQHYCLLLLIHLVDGIEQPEHEDDQTADDPEPLGDPLTAADPTTAAAIAGTAALLVAEDTVQAVLQLAQRLIQIRWPLLAATIAPAAVTTTPPGILVVRVVATTRLIPRHSVLRYLKP